MTWQTKKVNEISYVTDFVANGSFASLKENVKYIKSPDYAILVRLTDFTKKWNKDFVYVSKSSYDFLKKSSLFPGDLIMSNVGEPGIVFLVPDLNKPMTLGPNSILIRPDKAFTSSKFLYLYFLSKKGKEKIDGISAGAAQKKFNKTSFRELEISFPSIPEQKRIVKKLDEVFEKAATAKENAEKNLQNSKKLFESYLQSVFANPGEDWEEQSLSNVCEVEYGYTEKAKSEGDYRFVRITDTDENGLLTQENKMYVRSFDGANKYLLSDGDLLMARTGASAGNVLFFESDEKAIFASYLIRLKFKKEVSSKLYWFFSKSKLYWDQVKQLSAGSAQPQFNGGALKKITFPFPKSLHEQKAIIKKLDALSVETKKLGKIYEQKLVNLEELKKSVLSKAFNGEL